MQFHEMSMKSIARTMSIQSMKFLDLTLATPEANLALEEALLEWAEASGEECLRLWESPEHFVVLGAGSPVKTDVNLAVCAERHIPVLRRCSGGGSVIQGPGCLNYTLVLDKEKRDILATIDSTSKAVLAGVARAIVACGGGPVSVQGYSDLTCGALKFSGNAQRRRKRFILFHGTILHRFDLDLLSTCLGRPEKMPDYREGRDHGRFVINLEVDVERLKQEIRLEWSADEELTDWPAERADELALGRYADQVWIQSI